MKTPHDLAREAQAVVVVGQKTVHKSNAQVACEVYDFVKAAIEVRDAEWQGRVREGPPRIGWGEHAARHAGGRN